MTMRDAVSFIAKASEERALSDRVTNLDAETLVELGRRLGFSFTLNELRAVASSEDVAALEDGGELSETDLDAVAGGFDISGVAQAVMRGSYAKAAGDLGSLADRLRRFNSVKSSIRDNLD